MEPELGQEVLSAAWLSLVLWFQQVCEFFSFISATRRARGQSSGFQIWMHKHDLKPFNVSGHQEAAPGSRTAASQAAVSDFPSLSFFPPYLKILHSK